MDRLRKPIQDLFLSSLHEIHEAIVSALPLSPTHDGAMFEWTISGNVCDYDSLVESRIRFVAGSDEHDRVRTDVTGAATGLAVRLELLEKINLRLEPFDLVVSNSSVDQVASPSAPGTKSATVSLHLGRLSWSADGELI
jgi:hypothetical protein